MNKQSKQWLAIVVLAVCIGALGGMMIKQRHESKALYDAFRSLNTSAGQEKTVPIKMETNQWKTVADSLQWRLSDLEALVCLIKSHDDQVIYCSLKVGDSIKGMTVVAGQTGTHFKGRKTVTGTYDLRPVTGDSLVDWVCMVLDSASVEQFPKFLAYDVAEEEVVEGASFGIVPMRRFCFSNEDMARKLLKPGKHSATVQIDDFIWDHRPTETTNRAQLIKVITNN